ncbi:hypothetical protein [Caulobacter sp. 17J65-9]|uniref:hypothetical protein n=1 Tax=Caulobacter sp. 17J65-9 TaxID=2709382 RepID=UPI0013C723D0|nr:hypothetical protein [Caulobacter sp. 17J65-9]NEX91546.1 hypothetical protein [Caulobacter sp. 17J65-9]
MMIRPWTEFSSTLPEEDEREVDGVYEPPGKNVAEVVYGILGGLGCDLGPLEGQGEEHGWQFHFRYKKCDLWCQVTLIYEYLAVIEEISFFRKLFRRPHHPAYLELLERLSAEMARDPRLYEVRWYADEEVHTDAPGAASPVPSAA